MEDWQWVVDIFTFIGISVSIIIALIAIVWLTCFFVKLLVKTFGLRVGKSYDLMVEDINKKAEAKKTRNEMKRNAKLAQKMELLNMKLESKERVHEMKKAKLEGTLSAKEAEAKVKLFGEDAQNYVTDKKTKAKVDKKQEIKVEETNFNEEEKESEEVFENIADVVDAVDGEVSTGDHAKAVLVNVSVRIGKIAGFGSRISQHDAAKLVGLHRFVNG